MRTSKFTVRHTFALVAAAITLGTMPAIEAGTRPSTGSEIVADYNAYKRGWDAGWAQGWKKVKGQFFIPPIPPIPPIPSPGELNYQGGYNNGFLAGINAANRG